MVLEVKIYREREREREAARKIEVMYTDLSSRQGVDI